MTFINDLLIFLTLKRQNNTSQKWSGIEQFQWKWKVYWQLFTKIDFPPFLVAILNFCAKHKNVFISEKKRDRTISPKCLTRRVSLKSVGDFSQKSFSRHLWRPSWISAFKGKTCLSWQRRERCLWSPLATFCKNHFPASLAAILNFCVKCKNVFISDMERRNIWNTGYLQSLVATKIVFLPILAAILNFCVKHKNLLISETEPHRAILTRFLTHRLAGDSTGEIFSKKIFSPLMVAILHFCIKHKNAFISETERDRLISAKFLTHRVSLDSTSDFLQKSFSRHFWWPSWISACLFQKWSEIEWFQQSLWPTG